MRGRPPIPIEERFWKYVFPEPNSGCWLWTASLDSKGYGQIGKDRGGLTRAHQVSYRIHKGAVPAGLEIDHLCRVRNCVNPDHLEAVTRRENIRRGVSLVAERMRQTHCIRGHPFDEKNTHFTKQGWRQCRKCHSKYVIKAKQLKRAKLREQKQPNL